MIPFPTIHIAESVLNRISNALEGDGPLALPMPAPTIPDPAPLGVALDEQLVQPPAPSAPAPEAVEEAGAGAIESSLLGGSPFDGALIGAGAAL